MENLTSQCGFNIQRSASSVTLKYGQLAISWWRKPSSPLLPVKGVRTPTQGRIRGCLLLGAPCFMGAQVTGSCLSERPIAGNGLTKTLPICVNVAGPCGISSAGLAPEEFTPVFHVILLQNSGWAERREGPWCRVSAEAHGEVHSPVRRNVTCFAF